MVLVDYKPSDWSKFIAYDRSTAEYNEVIILNIY
jgi:hypothetical protein